MLGSALSHELLAKSSGSYMIELRFNKDNTAVTQFEKMFRLMTRPWFIILYILLVFLAYHYADKPVAIFFHDQHLRSDVPLLHALTFFGKWKIYVLLFAVAGVYFQFIQKNQRYAIKSWFLLACVFIPNVINFFIKICFSRSRPDLLFADNTFGFYWFQLHDLYWSFPSGHTVTIISLISGLGIVFPRYFYPLLGLGLLVVISRVLLYFHYLSDVMTAFYLSIFVIGLMMEYLRKKKYLAQIVD